MAKVCPRCKKDKPRDEFFANKKLTDGLQNWCKDCQILRRAQRKLQDPEKRKIYQNSPDRRAAKAAWSVAYAKRRSDYILDYRLKKDYGLSLEQYKSLLDAQGGVCAMCKKPETSCFKGKTRRLSVDHCHATGKIRGLLCTVCNVVARPDDIDFLRLRIAYLTKNNESPLTRFAEGPSDPALVLAVRI